MELEEVRGELEAAVSGEMERLHVPGVVVGILHGSEELVAAFGVTSIDHPLEVTDTTLFQIGSTTKTFTATALMRKVDEGVLDLDAPLQTYLPDFKLANAEWARQVTAKHLLTHTAGWDGDYLIVHPVGGRGGNALTSVVEAMPSVPLLTPPGTLFHYNVTGFSIAGRLLEVLTSQRYEAAIRELILRPLKLANSFFLPEEVVTRGFAVGHLHARPSEAEVERRWAVARCLWPTGGIVSDVHDQLRWARFHLGNGKASAGEQLLGRETLIRMQTPHVEVGDWPDAVGLSWLLRPVGGAKTVGHGGTTMGQCSMLWMIPERACAVVILTNADTGGFLADEVYSWVHERVLGLAAERPELIELPGEVLEEYAGTYRRELITLEVMPGKTGLEMEVFTRDPRKGQTEALEPIPIGFCSRDRLVVLAGREKEYRATFIRDADGAIEWLRWSGRLHRRIG